MSYNAVGWSLVAVQYSCMAFFLVVLGVVIALKVARKPKSTTVPLFIELKPRPEKISRFNKHHHNNKDEEENAQTVVGELLARGQINIWAILFVIIAIAILTHLIAGIGSTRNGWYRREILAIGSNPIRWMEQAINGSLIMIALAVLVGIRSSNILILFPTAEVGRCFLLLTNEQSLKTADRMASPHYHWQPNSLMVCCTLLASLMITVLEWTVIWRQLRIDRNLTIQDCKERKFDDQRAQTPPWLLFCLILVFTLWIAYWLTEFILAVAGPEQMFYYYEIAMLIMDVILYSAFVLAIAVGLVKRPSQYWVPIGRPVSFFVFDDVVSNNNSSVTALSK